MRRHVGAARKAHRDGTDNRKLEHDGGVGRGGEKFDGRWFSRQEDVGSEWSIDGRFDDNQGR